MTGLERLHSISGVAAGVTLPTYDPAAHGTGIVHIGPGAFHKAHQAVYTDDALSEDAGNWRITGISPRGTAVAEALNPQNGLYTVLERDAGGTRARIIASVARIIAATQDRQGALDALAAPATRIVSLTVTEKAYGIDRAAGALDTSHPAIASDLANPRNPVGVLAMMVEGLRRRRDTGTVPFTVLCCDNLPENGALVKTGVLDFAARIDPALRDWIEANVTFPSTMVDRITPAPTQTTLDDAARLTGCTDLAAIETEPFTQWVIEDRFVAGRPLWEAGGALFVADVAPYERMKLRMLNGTHSMLAYCGFLSGCAYVRDVMANPGLAALVKRHLAAAAATLAPLQGIDFAAYAQQLQDRFANPAIAHETYQIAMDGTEKLPQRIFQPALHALDHGQDTRPFAFATAAWMRYCLGRKDDGETYALRDPREEQIGATLAAAGDARGIVQALHTLPGLAPPALASNARWMEDVTAILATMKGDGMQAAIAKETGQT